MEIPSTPSVILLIISLTLVLATLGLGKRKHDQDVEYQQEINERMDTYLGEKDATH